MSISWTNLEPLQLYMKPYIQGAKNGKNKLANKLETKEHRRI